MLLSEAMDRFVLDCGGELSVATVTGYRSAVRSIREFGIERTQDLIRPRMAEWLASRRATSVVTATINTQLAGILAVAGHLERCGLFPLKRLLGLRRLRMRTKPQPPALFLTREAVAKLRSAALAVDPDLDLAISFAIFAGLRLSEIQKLCREDLDLDGRASFVRIAKDGHGRRHPRTTPIAKEFAAELLARGLPASGPIFVRRYAFGKTPYLGHGTFKKWLREARDAADLYFVTWFVLRHCFASWLRQGGVELSKISGWMGNTIRVCEKHYASLAPGGDPEIERGFKRLDDLEAKETRAESKGVGGSGTGARGESTSSPQ